LKAEVQIYSSSRGLFAGAFLDGSTLRPETTPINDRTSELSEQKIVLQGKVAVPSAAELLLSELNEAVAEQ
jgi:lipid-binding SYLF domain-containing protein